MLGEVLDSIVEYKRLGIWIELTTLIIPDYNDSDPELMGLARFIADKVGVETPWHVTQYYPTYKLTASPRTPVETLRRARRIGLDAGLRYVYEGNVPGEGGENTCCPGCSELLIRRQGFFVEENRIREGKCPSCGTTIDGIGM
ncbi:MAG TPA: radical SAM protein, partial [Geobacteraceae bacterium]|nr:radical SAM protein [Geobacteraceae bacterium]